MMSSGRGSASSPLALSSGDVDVLLQGLTPSVFHQNRDDLLIVEKNDLPSEVDGLVSRSRQKTAIFAKLEHLKLDRDDNGGTSDGQEDEGLTPIPNAESHLLLALGSTASSSPFKPSISLGEAFTIRILPIDKPLKDQPFILPLDAKSALSTVPDAKLNGKEYGKALLDLIAFIRALPAERAVILRPGQQMDLDSALMMLESEKDYAGAPVHVPPPLDTRQVILEGIVEARKTILPLALALLCAIPRFRADYRAEAEVTKGMIASQLHQLVALWPDGNPPRVALRRVNEVLMSQKR